jgi:hypothetical protein
MIEAGVAALREWLDNDDRYKGNDARAVSDAFSRMYARLPETQGSC